ncbi:MAG: hypothetical protein ABSF51_10630 [Verrucomicrobiota bacterium]|jgi:16S rRNA G966 N2-methylase RsmD
MDTLYYGDNLQILREYVADDSVDLIYLDPPFNSKRDYNLLFKSPKGQTSEAQNMTRNMWSLLVAKANQRSCPVTKDFWPTALTQRANTPIAGQS